MSRVNPTLNERFRTLMKPWHDSVNRDIDRARKKHGRSAAPKLTIAELRLAKKRRIARALGPFNSIGELLDSLCLPTLTDGVDYVALNPATGKLEGHVVTDPAVRALVASAIKRMEAS